MVRILVRTAPGQAQAASGHVDAAGRYTRLLGQRGFDQPYASAALQAVNRERQFFRAIRFSNNMPGKIPSLRWFWPQSARTDRVHALKVVTAETQALYNIMGCCAASAAELAARRGRQAAMRTNRLRKIDRG
jgi:hypothetical protein